MHAVQPVCPSAPALVCGWNAEKFLLANRCRAQHSAPTKAARPPPSPLTSNPPTLPTKAGQLVHSIQTWDRKKKSYKSCCLLWTSQTLTCFLLTQKIREKVRRLNHRVRSMWSNCLLIFLPECNFTTHTHTHSSSVRAIEPRELMSRQSINGPLALCWKWSMASGESWWGQGRRTHKHTHGFGKQ